MKIATPEVVFGCRSDDIDQVVGALAIAQGLYKKLIPNREIAGGSYADLESILQSTREALSSNGLAFVQLIELTDEGMQLLKTIIAHSSGQFISSWARIVPGETVRETANILEIQKRLQAMLLLGVAPSNKDPIAVDDDGMREMEVQTVERLKKGEISVKKSDKIETISKSEYENILVELANYPEILEDVLRVYKIETIADLPKTEYHPALRRIRNLIDNFKNYRINKK